MSDRHTAGPTEAEKDAFFAQIAADEKRKLDAHDDLVKALIRAIEWCEHHGDTRHQWLRDGKEALRKATGEQQ